MQVDRERVLAGFRASDTDDLLDRVTVYRAGMEPEAVEMILEELRQRGVDAAQVRAHGERRGQGVLWQKPGLAWQCAFCRGPAVARRWHWQRLWGRMPLFPRRVFVCASHQGPTSAAKTAPRPAE
jgi:hypothetical protein